jgi:hypothetical protein
MSVRLKNKIARLDAALAAETDPKEKAALRGRCAALAVALAEMDGDGEDGDGEGDGDGDGDEEESKSAKAEEKARKAKGKAEAAKHSAKAAEHEAKAAKLRERAKKCEDEGADSEEAEAAAAMAIEGASATMPTTDARSAAMAAQAALVPGLVAQVEALAKRRNTDDREAAISVAFAKRLITPAQRKMLASKPLAFVTEYLTMCTSPVLPSSEAELDAPQVDATGADLGREATIEIDKQVKLAASHFRGTPDEVASKTVKLRADMIANARAAMNGAALGRY